MDKVNDSAIVSLPLPPVKSLGFLEALVAILSRGHRTLRWRCQPNLFMKIGATTEINGCTHILAARQQVGMVFPVPFLRV
ncbi:MAG: hypothetical protein R2932_30065 [Caldilineaceae bacterium]